LTEENEIMTPIRWHALVPVLLAAAPVVNLAQTADARKKLNSYLADIGIAQLARRSEAVAAIRTREDADRRKAEVRKKILDLIGGLPESHGPVRVKEFGVIQDDGFRIEKVAYQSLPDFWVTANVYVPAGAGPFPAIILTPGHGPGKESQAAWAANLAHNGVIALAVDTLGAGERYQHYDPELETSRVERSGEHEHASLSTLLIGKHVSRYFINDGIRGIDYLSQRKDVNSAHLGAFGCSGGGTITAYLGALDPRIGVTATACYITSFKELLNSTGAQDGEQTIPDFVKDGLDFADWVDLCAPRAYAIVSTTEDMFPFAGARATYEEAQRIYALYGADSRLQFITGPGGHGNLGPISPQILDFLVRNLTGEAPKTAFQAYRPAHPDDLTDTPTGQVSTSIGGETVESINRKEAAGLMVKERPVDSKTALAALQNRVRREARAVAGMTAQPGDPPLVTVESKEQKDGYRVETLTIHSEPGIDLSALAIISDRAGPKPAVLMMDGAPKDRTAATPDVQRLAKSGHVVVLLTPRGVIPEASAMPGGQAPSILGSNTAIALQAMAVGKSLVGMRADDTIRVVNWLVSLPDVDKSAITVYGRGPEGMAALHAAVADARIAHVVLENTLTSYRMALESPLHRNLSDIILPGVLLHYDVADLLEAASPCTVVLVNPAGALGTPAREPAVRAELAAAFDTDRTLGTPERVRVARRGFRDPLPIE
jgi:dienelactone hydrolase